MPAEILKCKKGDCQLEIQTGLFACKYVYCWHCDKSAVPSKDEQTAIENWNRLVESL